MRGQARRGRTWSMWSRAARLEAFEDLGLALSLRRDRFVVLYSEILTAERLTNRRGLKLHLRGAEPVVVSVKRGELLGVENRLWAWGVRIVDCWGAILAPTFADFEEELDLEPGHLRQSSDDA